MSLTLNDLRSMNAYQLAGPADCASPDTLESYGARLLTDVRDDVVERVESWREDNPTASWSELEDALADDVHEIADSAPNVYTYQRWQEFVDLAAWQEEPETGEWPDDLTDAAGIALYQIADRLAHSLIHDLSEQEDEEDEDDDEDDDED